MAKALRLLALMALWLCLSKEADAQQGCPPGFVVVAMQSADQAVCAPIPRSADAPVRAEPTPVWETRWGAIAVTTRKKDGVSELGEGIAGLGIARHMPSEDLAQRHALQDCQLHGDGCKLKLTYQDQCGVVVWGLDLATFASGPTLEAAEKIAMNDCVQSSKDCKTYYYDCSYPARVQ